MTTCTHLDAVRDDVAPLSADGCIGCRLIGESWVDLRMCLTCGYVGCCDSSPYRHATGHHQETGHPIIRSFEPGEDWRWCFVDESLV